MSLIGNILWIIFGGLIAALGYFIGGFVLCLTIVGIPFGVQAFKLGAAVFAPFGKKVVDRSSGGCLQVTFNIVWILLFGWEIAIAHVLSAILLAITIVGIPFAKQHIKLVPLSLLPFGHEMVDAE
jgi:uncharacterized membrane protein YccF (DUF307 family)